MSTHRASRADKIGDAAIAVLASSGMRGLTHRAVDQAAGLPQGTTSNYARTRAALIGLSLTRTTELESADIAALTAEGVPADTGQLAELIARIVARSIAQNRPHMLARYELALEATRRPELRAAYDEVGLRFRQEAEALLAAAGSRDPARHARMLMGYAEGIMFDTIAGTAWQHTPTIDEIRRNLSELLATMTAAQTS